MKYWNELIAIESESIRLECLKSLVNVVANGSEGSTHQEMTNALWHISGSLEDINEKLKQAYSDCFDAVRDEDLKIPDYEFDELQTAVNSWHQNKTE
jgi:hypothetical protein